MSIANELQLGVPQVSLLKDGRVQKDLTLVLFARVRLRLLCQTTRKHSIEKASFTATATLQFPTKRRIYVVLSASTNSLVLVDVAMVLGYPQDSKVGHTTSLHKVGMMFLDMLKLNNQRISVLLPHRLPRCLNGHLYHTRICQNITRHASYVAGDSLDRSTTALAPLETVLTPSTTSTAPSATPPKPPSKTPLPSPSLLAGIVPPTHFPAFSAASSTVPATFLVTSAAFPVPSTAAPVAFFAPSEYRASSHGSGGSRFSTRFFAYTRTRSAVPSCRVS
ncbi:hypothetical protein FN846DRAFT_888699 [Sphaerosporella brunnea]|uniref:Uncharacterized protein n=1 Tax=Sphaerosporella brunnea TaxID=1250544 RepID=A0A5J5F1W2_9PEZI|nr:hypothetical protein FN846DRAFT_888699 [Sphaerosporella brunnea]